MLPGADSRSRLRSAPELDGISATAIPPSGHASASAAIAADPLIGSACGAGSVWVGRRGALVSASPAWLTDLTTQF